MDDLLSIVNRLQTTHKGVIGVVIARADGACVHTTLGDLESAKVIDMAMKINTSVTDAVKNSRYDPQASKDKEKSRQHGSNPPQPTEIVNPVELMRINTTLYDMIITAYQGFMMITLQHPDAASSK
eukprot:TRINITY_DN4539_c0_g1_i1.p1 TRINITY_DN4539_c0_g1~~TRINITY_DN4539_c0_g1_i1.p1  ORF type:complete len:126 (-),score=23.02 TRINITY_DN4539_c0_g1_i1:107-484(-)